MSFFGLWFQVSGVAGARNNGLVDGRPGPHEV